MIDFNSTMDSQITFYHSQVQRLHNDLYPKDYLLKQVIRSKKFIDNNFSEPMSLNDIAGEAYLSKFHFIRSFRNCYGVTPHQYLIRVRVAEAKKLIRSGTLIAAACYAVGFESLPSFANLFKKLTGTTPLACQLKQLKSNIR